MTEEKLLEEIRLLRKELKKYIDNYGKIWHCADEIESICIGAHFPDALAEIRDNPKKACRNLLKDVKAISKLAEKTKQLLMKSSR